MTVTSYDPRDPEQRAELVAAIDTARARLQAAARPLAAGQGVQLQLGQEDRDGMNVLRHCDRWTIHRTFGIGLIREDQPNAVVSGRALNEGEKVEVVESRHLEGAVAKINGALAIMEARQSLSGQIPLARDPAAQVLALLRDAAGGQ